MTGSLKNCNIKVKRHKFSYLKLFPALLWSNTFIVKEIIKNGQMTGSKGA